MSTERKFVNLYSPCDVRDYRIKTAKAAEFPSEFELKMGPIKDQGFVGSCVAHALAETIEYFNRRERDQKTPMSTDYIYGNRRFTVNMQEGLVLRDALKTVCKYGDVPKAQFSGNTEVPEVIDKFEAYVVSNPDRGLPYRFSSYARVSSISDIKHSLLSGYPVVIALEWYNDMKLDDDYVLTSKFKKADYSGGHCVVIYGWNERGWKVMNSWGKLWGNNGTFILDYEHPIAESWAISDTIMDVSIDKPYSSDFGKFIARVFNWVYNKVIHPLKKFLGGIR